MPRLLRRTEDRRTLTVVAISLTAAAALFLSSPEPWGLRVLGMVVVAQLFFVCAVIAHNSLHRPIFRFRPLNKAFQIALSVILGETASSFVPVHNFGHHTHLQTERDVMRTTKLRFSLNLLNQLLFTFVVGGAVTKATYGYFWESRHARPRWFRQVVFELAVLWTTWLVLLLVDWKSFLLYVFIPQQFAGWGIIGINYAQHDGCDPEHPYNHSRTFTGTFVNWWTFNNGFHGAHHMRPGAHWSELPKVNQELLAPHCHPELQQHSLLAYLLRAHVWPGRRLRYDGQEVMLPAPRSDVRWHPKEKTSLVEVSFGAESP